LADEEINKNFRIILKKLELFNQTYTVSASVAIAQRSYDFTAPLD